MEFLHELKQRNEPLFWFGLICLILALACLLLTKISGIQVLGTSAWYKPFKFFLSTTIFVWSMGWYAHYLNEPSKVLWYSWGLMALFTIEDVYIFIQAMRGTTSHFNVSNGFYSFMWAAMGICAVGISIWTAVIGIGFFNRSFPELEPAYLWGIRLGLIVFVIFSIEGMAMGARMAHTVGAADGSQGIAVVNWSKQYGDLRIAHFFGMHALQLLPLIGFFLLRDLKIFIPVALAYGVFCAFALIQALQGKPLIGK